MPFAAPRNPVDVTAQVLNDPSILDKSLRPVVRQGEFPGDGRLLHDLGEFAADGRAAVPGGQRRGGTLSRPLFRAVGDRHPGDAAPLRGGRGRPVRGPVARRRIDRRGGARRRAAQPPPLPVPPVPREPAAVAEGPHRRARSEADPRRRRHPGPRRRLATSAGQAAGRRRRHRRAAGAEDRVARHPA